MQHLIYAFAAFTAETLIAFRGFELETFDFNRQTAQITIFFIFAHRCRDQIQMRNTSLYRRHYSRLSRQNNTTKPARAQQAINSIIGTPYGEKEIMPR